MVGSDKINRLALDAVESTCEEWDWKLTPREQQLAVKAAKRAACNAVALALMEERQN